MASWRDVAAQVMEQPVPALAPPEPDHYGLAAELYGHLARLKRLSPPPKIATQDNWAGVVSDALRLAQEGWAVKAIALGWSWADLFGVGPADDYEFAGLAVWINGRSIAALDERLAIVIERGKRDTFIRGGLGHGTHPTVEPVLLWGLGRA